MISIRPSQVPHYLRGSEFYNALNLESDDEFTIAEEHFKPSSEVHSRDDLQHLLSTMKFWGSYIFAPETLEQMLNQATVGGASWMSDYEDAFPILVDVKEIAAVACIDKPTVAAKSESHELFVHIAGNGNIHSAVLAAAAEHGRLANLTLAYEMMSNISWFPMRNVSCHKAAQNGHLNCLKFLYENGCSPDDETCPAAAGNGHLDCLKYAHEHGFPLNDETMMAAIIGGHMDCVRYAHQRGCALPKYGAVPAAENGHLGCLKYAFDQGSKHSTKVCTAACKGGHLQCLQYAVEHGCGLTATAYAYAAAGGHVDCMKYLHERRCVITYLSLDVAISNNQWESVKFLVAHSCVKFAIQHNSDACLALLRECGIPFRPEATGIAMRHNSVYCLQYLHEEGLLHWSTSMSIDAIHANSWSALMFACEHDYSLSAQATTAVAEVGNLPMLKYLHEHGCVWDELTCFVAAKRSSYYTWSKAFKYMQCAHMYSCFWGHCHATTTAAEVRNLQFLKHQRAHGCKWDLHSCFAAAKTSDCYKWSGAFECLKYAHENGCPWDEQVSAAATGKTLIYCVEHGCPVTGETIRRYNCAKAAQRDHNCYE